MKKVLFRFSVAIIVSVFASLTFSATAHAEQDTKFLKEKKSREYFVISQQIGDSSAYRWAEENTGSEITYVDSEAGSLSFREAIPVSETAGVTNAEYLEVDVFEDFDVQETFDVIPQPEHLCTHCWIINRYPAFELDEEKMSTAWDTFYALVDSVYYSDAYSYMEYDDFVDGIIDGSLGIVVTFDESGRAIATM